MINKTQGLDIDQIKGLYARAFERIAEKESVPEIDVRFYPYVNINHTIRVRKGKVFVRISHLFEAATPEAHESLAIILVSKLIKKRVPPRIRKIYREFINTEDIRKQALRNKRERGRKFITTTKGRYFDLEEIFRELNQRYFENEVPETRLTWSKRRTYRRLGHYDSAHELITISKSLDGSEVPRFVVEYIVYHEMLHVVFPTEHRNGRRYSHTPEFKRAEERFPKFEEAEEWIERFAARLRGKAGRRN